MLRPEELREIGRAVRSAAEAVAFLPDDQLEPALFAHWTDVMHRLLIGRGCPCTAGRSSDCFRGLSDEMKREKFVGGDLAFEEFVAIIRESRGLCPS